MTIAITMGDASGVGPEIALHAFAKGELPGDALVIGDYAILAHCNEVLDYRVSLQRVADGTPRKEGALQVIDLGLLQVGDLRVGEVSQQSGRAALRYVEHATRLALDARVAAVVTLPINKEATRLSEAGFSGHTEYIATLCGRTESALMLVSDRLIVAHVSTHVSMREAIARVRKARVLDVIELTHGILPRLRASTRIAVAGLNPHAGEGGAFGQEELDEITPAIERARAAGIDASGPFPPDVIFRDALSSRYDAVVCMYHDQGHIPMKVTDFEGAVNVTLGLPIVRTSVDHGTAFDIAYQGVASTRSLKEASQLAVRLATTTTST